MKKQQLSDACVWIILILSKRFLTKIKVSELDICGLAASLHQPISVSGGNGGQQQDLVHNKITDFQFLGPVLRELAQVNTPL